MGMKESRYYKMQVKKTGALPDVNADAHAALAYPIGATFFHFLLFKNAHI
jgi:hypothetical protein